MSSDDATGSELPNLFIYGSCVSRDTYEFMRERARLGRYVARQSAISAFAPVNGVVEQLNEIASPFQQRMVEGDLAGSLPDELRKAAGTTDLVVIDLVDERGGVMRFEDGVATRLSEFWSAGGREASRGAAHVQLGTDEHFEAWSAAVERLKLLLVDLDLFDRTLVLRSPWADRDDHGDPLELPSWMLKPAVANDYYERYFAKLEQLGFELVTLPEELAYSPLEHKWGTSPFHYSPAAYEYFADAITQRLAPQPSGAPYLARRDTAAWGEFINLQSADELRSRESVGGFYTVWRAGWPIDLLIEDNGAATTLVSFHAALGSNTSIRPPVFTGRSVTEGQPVNRVFVSDPTLLANETLGLGWYLGAKKLPLTEALRDIIDAIQTNLGAQYLAFYGMSGGGFASLNISHEFPGSLAVPVNPQTRILDYAKVHWQAMAEAAFEVEGEEAARRALEDHPRADQRAVYAEGHDNAVLYVQNRKDAHVSLQLIPFMEQLGWSSDIGILLGDWGDGHVPPKAPVLAQLLQAIPRVDGDWAKLGSIWGAKFGTTRDWLRAETGR